MFVKATVAYIAVMIEIFIICFAGEYLSLKVSKYNIERSYYIKDLTNTLTLFHMINDVPFITIFFTNVGIRI